MSRLYPILFAALTCLTVSPAAIADENEKSADATILGFVEWIVLDNPELRLKARLDTGANTASVHATDIEEFEQDGEGWVRFDLPLDHHKEIEGEAFEQATLTFERPIERTILVKRKGADPQRRHVVMMDFCLDGQQRRAQFSLTDRSDFTYPALLGRRFMAGEIIVDPSDSFLAESECEYSDLEEVAESVDG